MMGCWHEYVFGGHLNALSLAYAHALSAYTALSYDSSLSP